MADRHVSSWLTCRCDICGTAQEMLQQVSRADMSHLVEHLELVDSVVAHKCLADKQHQLWLILVYELAERSH